MHQELLPPEDEGDALDLGDIDLVDGFSSDDPRDGVLGTELTSDPEREHEEDLGVRRIRQDAEGRPVAGLRETPRDDEPRTLRPYQAQAVSAVTEDWDSGRPFTSVILPTGTGKALADDTLIPTDRGMVPIGTVTARHRVVGPEGTHIGVLDVQKHDELTLYQVRVSDAPAITACEDHLWTVRLRDDEDAEWETITTAELARRVKAAPRKIHELPPMTGMALAPTPSDRAAAEAFWDPATAVPGPDFLDRLRATPLPVRFAMVDHLAAGGDTIPFRQGKLAEAAVWLVQSVGFRAAEAVAEGAGRTVIHLRVADSIAAHTALLYRNVVSPADVATWHPWVRFEMLDALSRRGRAGDLQGNVAVDSLRASFGSVDGPIITGVSAAGTGPATCLVVDHPEQLFAAGTHYTMTHNSTVIGEIAVRARDAGKRVVLLAHRAELLSQMADAVYALDPDGDDVGIMAGPSKNPEPAIVAAMFQTLAASKDTLDMLGPRDVVLVDEAHHAMARTYLATLAGLGLPIDIDAALANPQKSDFTPTGKRPDIVACGFTATMRRADSRRLGALWQHVSFERDIGWAIENGFLVKPTGRTVRTDELNQLASIKAGADGDYNSRELDHVMRASVPTTVDAVKEHAADRSMIVFAASVEHAHLLAAALSDAGILAESVTGSDPLHVREATYERFRSGHTQALVTVMVLTEGADFPRCDCVVMARPTRSEVLFCQMAGRAVRTYTDPDTGKEKTNALVLDLAGMSSDMSLVSLTDMWGPAEVAEYDTDGTVIEKPEFDEAHKMPGEDDESPERIGRADLTTVDLLDRRGGEFAKVVILETPGGVQFVPGAARRDAGLTAWVAWPPSDNLAAPTALVHSDFDGNLSVFRDENGEVVLSDQATVLAEARRMAVESDCYRTFSRSKKPATAGQSNMLRALGGYAPPNLTRVDASAQITARLLDRQLRRNGDMLNALAQYAWSKPPIDIPELAPAP